MSYVSIRSINKQQAIRHLIHAAIRMIRAEEDPFAIQVLIQSADKMLIDLAKRSGKKILVEWKGIIKSGDADYFIKRYRDAYNFFKHADKDHDKNLPVPNMMRLNTVVLAVCIMNYENLFSGRTQHMSSHLIFAITAFPGNVFLKEAVDLKQKASFTPRDFFSSLTDSRVASSFLQMEEEKKHDLIDHGAFYDTPMSEIDKRTLQ